MAVAALPRVYALSMRELYAQVIADVSKGEAGTIHPELYRAYSENLRKAVSGFAPPAHSSSLSYKSYQDLQAQFEANLSRFAAYKAWHATRQLERQLADPDGVQRTPEEFDRMARAVLNTFNRYQAAEYNTAVSRARTAHQWQQFSQGDNMFLFPNLRWLPSRSANPREAHMPFYNRVWAKTDPFWQTNQPGNLWNCKCDWEETDDPVTGDNPEGIRPARGLEGNPAETGEIFTDECTYFKNISNTKRKKMEHFVGDKFLRQESHKCLHAMQGKPLTIDKRGEKIEVVFDSKTTLHLSNDVAENCNFLWNASMPRIRELLENATLVAHELNTKTDKKPWAVEYFYYEYKTTHYTFYLNVEYNDIVDENRQFYRLYSITSKLRESATMY